MAGITDYSGFVSSTAELYLYEKIQKHIYEAIEEGSLSPGEKLPSLRSLSRRYGCSVSVVMQAYEILEAQGKITAVEKSGYFVRDAAELPIPTPQNDVFTLDSAHAQPLSIIGRIVEASNDPSIVPLGAGMPHPDFLPLASLKRHIHMGLKDSPRQLGSYTDELGSELLRSEIKQIMLARGVEAGLEDIIITNGCTEALSLAIQSCTAPGDVVVLESPVFLGVVQILDDLKRRIITVPTSPAAGIDLDRLEEVLKKDEVKAVVLTALYQNPLGYCMSVEDRKRAAHLAERYRTFIIEDDIYHDTSFTHSQGLPIKHFDREGWVMYCCSFSKTLSPGLRIGWMMGGQKQRRCRNLKMSLSLGNPLFLQNALASFLQSTQYEKHIITLQKIMARQAVEMSRLLKDMLPDGAAVSKPAGGYYLWVELPGRVDTLALFEEALKKGISIVPGQAFSPDERYRNCMRITYAAPIDDKMREGVNTLGKLIRLFLNE